MAEKMQKTSSLLSSKSKQEIITKAFPILKETFWVAYKKAFQERSQSKDINDNAPQITEEDRKLFSSISTDINSFPEKYRDAGKWLDEQYGTKKFYQRKAKKLGKLIEYWKAGYLGGAKSKEEQATEIFQGLFILIAKLAKLNINAFFKLLIESLKETDISTESQITVKKHLKLAKESLLPLSIKHLLLIEALNDLLEDKTIDHFISIEVARRICLITWILTFPEAKNKKLGITRFEKWQWIGEHGRYSLNYFWKKGCYKKWVGFAKTALANIEAEKECEGETEQETKRRGKGVLNQQVGELLKSFPSDISAPEIAKTLNKTYAGVYKPTSGSAVSKTENWKQRHRKKKSSRKK